MTTEILILRLTHVLGGIFWVGSAIFTTVFLVPVLSNSGPTAGQIFAALQRRRLTTCLFAAALLTIASGLRLLWITSAGLSSTYLDSAVGRSFVASGTTATLAFLITLLVGRPSGQRAARLGAELPGAPPEKRAALGAEVAKLRRRGAIAGTTVATLLVLSAAGMAVARYAG